MTHGFRTPDQEAEDKRILEKLASRQELTEEEKKHIDKLIFIAASKLGITEE